MKQACCGHSIPCGLFMLRQGSSPSTHRACNFHALAQALICTALNLPPTYFRKLLQSNAATTVLDFQPLPDDPSVTQVIVDRLNQVCALVPTDLSRI